MIRSHPASPRPAGATGMIPAMGSSGFSAARIAMQPPSELPTTITPRPLA
jgi:hypothetical protein